jgi:hypothetical protein
MVKPLYYTTFATNDHSPQTIIWPTNSNHYTSTVTTPTKFCDAHDFMNLVG